MITRDYILSLPAGRELDVQVAEKVMGCKYPTVEEMQKEAERVWIEQPNCRYFHMGFEAWREDGEFKWRYTAKDYSSDIAAAMEAESKAIEHNVVVWATAVLDVLQVGGFLLTPESIEKIAHMTAADRSKAALLAVIES